MGRMDPKSIIKGRIAEAIVEELLRSSGNKVYRFGYESILQNLTQTDSRFHRYGGNAEQVRSIPDFVVVNSEGQSFFVEVKFRADPVWFRTALQSCDNSQIPDSPKILYDSRHDAVP